MRTTSPRTSPVHASQVADRRRRRRTTAAAVVLLLVGIVAGACADDPGVEADDAPPRVLPADTRMGAVELRVADLEAQRAFYADVLGLEVLAEDDDTTSLGAGGEELVRLVSSDLPRPAVGDAGLYHSAILYPDEASLAAVLRQVATKAPESYAGASDHTVSQAFYFSDPEGNGLELYVDRPRAGWTWQDGRVQMGSSPLDPSAFIAEHATPTASGEPVVGHVHLQVGDLDEARRFYVDTLGFEITSEIDGALFMAAGGYHHHLAANTWSSQGAGRRSATTGLGSFHVLLPGADELEDLAQRLATAGHDIVRTATSLSVDDPWGNTVTLALAPSAPTVSP